MVTDSLNGESGVTDGGGATYGLQADALAIVNGCAERIRTAYRDETRRIFAIGQDLKEAKGHLRHGHFGRWLRAEFGWSERTAQRYMQAARVFGGKTDTVADLAPGAIYALSADSTPAAVRASVLARVKAGEQPDACEIKSEVANAKKAERAYRAEMRAVRDVSQPLPYLAAQRKAALAQRAASFILTHLGNERRTLTRLIEDVDPKALVEALLAREAVGPGEPIDAIEFDDAAMN
jgi:phenylpyruvate tautomerase PptA (4-oxalocrotonate tautomerase family)